ncbi:Ig-like domain-containing protein [Microbacterium sp. NPDC076895]|uniref:Ig-like domain-containing protein n=1 Tax=Microbacterium sp. NPDC076895 TaxID=3154957 RepID=UPI00344849FE
MGSALGVAATLVVGLAAAWPGYDAQQTPLDDGTIWALQRSAGGHYARVNAELLELDTVKQISQPTALAQTADAVWAFAASATRVAGINPATPPDLDAGSSDAFAATPAGTRSVSTSGTSVAYLTEAGEIFMGDLARPGAARLDIGNEEDPFAADALTVGPAGILAAYSADSGEVVRADLASGSILGVDEVPDAPGEGASLTLVGQRWVMLDAETGRLWIQGLSAPVETAMLPDARLAASSDGGDEVFLADSQELVAVALGDGAQRQVTGGLEVRGVPAAPRTLGGEVFAAWLGPTGGTLWSQSTGDSALDYAGAELGTDPLPEFLGTDRRLILNETQSGWVWTVPAGDLVPSSQSWQIDDQVSAAESDDAVAPEVVEPKPPVAENDAFGVRAGRAITLPVLLNDHDPNEDVLSVVPESVSASAFGTPVTTDADQILTIDVPADASGTATFEYRVTDGTAVEGLTSDLATVTLTVVPADENAAPLWCGTERCLANWPEPVTAPGGTVRFPILDAFVDPEGDALYVSAATVDAGPGTVTVDPAGILTYQHPDANAEVATAATVTVTVADSRGAATSRALTISVAPTPRLEADSFAVTSIVGRSVTVELRDRVRGGSGSQTLSAVTADNDDSGISVNASALSFSYTAQAPGSTVLTYTIRDGESEQTATVRVTAVAYNEAELSAPPLVAFVRPNEDSTVDVLSAVSNPAHLVLLVSDVRPQAAEGASVSVDPVAQSTIRVSGTTADGTPGEIGVVRYTISDGTEDPSAAITGQLTVILLPAATADPPIAVADSATVRVGGQIDIPVLANDSAPAGGQLAIDPSLVVNETDAGLAFATSRTLRYLAPDSPGVYSVTYTAYGAGYPELTDSARVTITVLGDEANTPPSPVTLEGRALSGTSTTIDFDPFGIDPDGDSVALDAVVDQPVDSSGSPAGTATISPDGTSLIYTAPPAWSGQTSFTYRVRDGRGATATALALVGVRDAQSDPRPVTFSDYVQLEGGQSPARETTITPLDNDVDPSGAKLTLVGVRPNAQPGTSEYDDLDAMLADVDLEGGSVAVRAGDALGTFSFVYTVTNAAGDTAMGLIVLKVVRNPVPDYPEVRDTVLTAETIDGFDKGIDVLTDKVTWAGGDPDSVKLALWRERSTVTVSGRRIAGTAQPEAMVIPFSVTGSAADGSTVTSYGFLRVPGESELRPTLRTGTGAFTVGENDSVEVGLAGIITVPRGAELEVYPLATTGGARGGASCELVGATTLRYTAGPGAPWNDTCAIQARRVGAQDWTVLTIRFLIEAEAPQPILSAASRTLSPGQTETYDLQQMTTWTGAPNWSSLQFAVEAPGDQFKVSLTGSRLEVTGVDNANPGRTEVVLVRLVSHPDTEPAALTLVVGPAPSTLPKAGTVTQQCSQAGGTTSCEIPVVGVAGEVNPLPGTPLRLASVTSPTNCSDVTFAVASASTVRATWTADAAGASDCTGAFVLADAQGRLSNGERTGTVVLDLRGLPAGPTTIEWTAFDATSVTLRVTGALGSYPAVESFRVSGGGQDITCGANGLCPAITAEAGKKIRYQAWAVNSVGESRAATSPVTAWPYLAPSAPRSASAHPVPTADGSGAVAAVTIGGFDPTTGSVRVTSPVTGDSETLPVPSDGGEVVFPEFAVGANRQTTLSVTPLSRFDYPPIASGTTEGTTTSVVAYGIGAPRLQLRLEPSDDGSGEVRAVATVAANGVDTELWVGITTGSTCTVEFVGNVTSGEVNEVISGTVWEDTTARACAEYRIGTTSFGRAAAGPVTAQPTEPIPAPSGTTTYTVDPAPTVSGQTATWTRVSGPSLDHPRYEARYGPPRTTDFASLFRTGTDPGTVQAWWCVGDACSDEATTITPTGAAYTTQVVFPATCDTGGQPSATMVDAAPADYSITTSGTPSADGTETAWEITVSFSGRLSGLDAYTHTGLVCPTPERTP